MPRFASALTLLVLLISAAPVEAGKYNRVLDVGDKAPAWQDLIGTDGEKHALADLKEKPAVVVVFTCNSCPYAVDYQDRINALAKKYDRRVAVVAINSNLTPENDLEAMKARAEKEGFVFPYLFDPSQQTAKRYGALRTPEFYLLDGGRRVAYMGSLDDNYMTDKVQHHYLANAIEAVLAGKKPAVAETPPIGCLIRFKRERRR
jgi:peroxiredoxin